MTSAEVREEAGTDEVAARAAVLTRPAHLPAANADDDEPVPLPDREVPAEQPVALPRQRDELTRRRCFLVAHVSRRGESGCDVCRDCL